MHLLITSNINTRRHNSYNLAKLQTDLQPNCPKKMEVNLVAIPGTMNVYMYYNNEESPFKPQLKTASNLSLYYLRVVLFCSQLLLLLERIVALRSR